MLEMGTHGASAYSRVGCECLTMSFRASARIRSARESRDPAVGTELRFSDDSQRSRIVSRVGHPVADSTAFSCTAPTRT